ncbi:sigma factor-like helix-turn-helix DNA-binding protein [Cryptosporangium sp. NPDC048952]|uniref:sigma factor-like helix-turn-helix DNA-binding protein n=1 Tax=Cryptosporangium sp. NPDC048952 TaxID=3363961 RepID=UPI003719F1EB
MSERMGRWRRGAFLLCRDWHVADDVVSVTVGRIFEKWRKAAAADNPDAYARRMLSVEETAEALDISSGTVKSQSARALTTLRSLANSPHA